MGNVFADFLQTASLYKSIDIREDNVSELMDLLKGNVKISTYCKECKQERVFTMQPLKHYFVNGPEEDEEILCRPLGEAIDSYQHMLKLSSLKENRSLSEKWQWVDRQLGDTTRLMNLEFVCSMDELHHLDFTILTNENSLMKIGQYPTAADMTFPALDDYRYVISKEDRKELGTAIGLFANGVGAGSYVYLRRILERLILQAKEKAGKEINSDDFEKAKTSDRIKMLKGYVPDMLVENTTIYGILSKGIHELSEEECLEYFPVVKECIFLILGMWEDIRKRQADEDSLNKALNSIHTKIK